MYDYIQPIKPNGKQNSQHETICRVKWRHRIYGHSRYDRHFVDITRHNVWSQRGEDLVCYLNKIESDGLKNVNMIINLLRKRI